MAQLMLVNPRKRRKSPAKRRKTSIAKRAVSHVKHKVATIRRRYKRNPIGGSANNAVEQFKTGAIGAAGALAVDVAMAKLPIPANLKTGAAAPIVKGLVGIGIGMAVAKFGKNRDLGKKLAQGAVTVSLYNAGREMLKAPLGLSDYDDLSAYDNDLSFYMGEYQTDQSDGMSDLLNGYDTGMGGDLLGAYDTGGAIVS